jgi:uncharacterized linocin/CFP29 family protein
MEKLSGYLSLLKNMCDVEFRPYMGLP